VIQYQRYGFGEKRGTAALVAGASLLFLLAGGGGCGPTKPPPAAERGKDAGGNAGRAAKPAAAEKRQPFPLAGTIDRPELTIDKDGVRVVRAKARAAAGGPGTAGGDGLGGTLRDAEATLYRDGKPAATLVAEEIAYRQTPKITITGRGGVVARSLAEKGAPTVRADRMVWHPDENQIRGDGNVRVTYGPGSTLSGTSFVADTRLKRVKILGGNDPSQIQF
jgi:hypothetical protein